MPLTFARALPVLLAFALAACGGSDDREAPLQPAPPPAKTILGVFGGKLSDEKEYDLVYVVMRDGTRVGFFGEDWSSSFKLVDGWTHGVVAWEWESSFGTLRRANGWYRGDVAFVSATFDMGVPQLSGQIAAAQSSTTPRIVAFGGGPIAGSVYRLDAPASLAAVEGRWDLADPAGTRITLDIAADGSLKGSYGGNGFTGSARPSRGGENALLVVLDFEPPDSIGDITGFAIAVPMAGGRARLLLYFSVPTAWDGLVTYFAYGER